MGHPLFKIEDTFIDSVCFGFSDAEVLGRFTQALEAARLEIRDAVRTNIKADKRFHDRADEFDVSLVAGNFVVIAPDDIEDYLLDYEYGLNEAPHPVLRNAVIQSGSKAQKAIEQSLEMT